MLKEVVNISHKASKDVSSVMGEATITAYGDDDNSFTVQFRNGAIANNVYGEGDYSVGDSVSIVSYPGRNKRYVIVSKLRKVTSAIKEVFV